MNEIKIPCVAVGTKTEELIRDAIEVKRENNAIKRRFIRQFFSTASQLERGTNQFNTSLYKSILEYGASEHFFKPWIPSTEVLLEIFNRSYKIATIAINMEVPLDRYADFWDMATIWEELDPETAAWVGESHQRNLPVLYATFAMVHAIVDREKDKSEFIEDFLDKMRTDEDVNEAMDFFLPADKQGVVTLKNDSVSSAPEHSNDTPAPTPTTPPKQKRGAKKTYLFTDGVEPQYAKHFRNFLHTYKHELTFTENMNDVVNIALRCFTFELDINLDRKDKACFRFLNESCGLEYKTNCTEQQPGQKWCKEFAKVKDDEPRGLISRQIKDFIEKQHVE